MTRRTCPISGLAAKRQVFSREAAPWLPQFVIACAVCPVSQRLPLDRQHFYGKGPPLSASVRGAPGGISRASSRASIDRAGCGCRSPDRLRRFRCERDRTWRSKIFGYRSRMVPGNTRQMHPCIALWAMRLLAGEVRAAGRGTTFRPQPSVWASNQPSFRRSVRSDAAVCRSWFRFGPLGRDLARRRTSRRFSTRFASL